MTTSARDERSSSVLLNRLAIYTLMEYIDSTKRDEDSYLPPLISISLTQAGNKV
jgi:hypothetical protein